MPDLIFCAVCEEPAGNPVDRAPWAPAPGGGVVCSPLCQLRAEFAHAADGRARAEALRRVLLESPEGSGPETVRLEVECDSPEFPRVVTCVGSVVRVDALDVVLEGGFSDGDEALIGWGRVVDAGEVRDDA